MGKVYPPYSHQGYAISHNRLRSHNSHLTPMVSYKRVWVRREEGTPTTLMVGPSDIVDDLKLAAIQKYPTTLARHYDPADLQLQIRVNEESQRRHKPKQPSFNRVSQDLEETLHRLPSVPSLAPYVTLEPDHNVWDVLDEYFGGEMVMIDAFLITVDKKGSEHSYEYDDISERHALRNPEFAVSHSSSIEPSQSISSALGNPAPQYHQPKPQHAFTLGENALIKNKSVSPSLSARLSPLSHVNLHKRSQSNPPLTPSIANSGPKQNNGQAVLLLPKNFTLGEQNPLKRYSLDESMVTQKYGEMSLATKQSNVTNIGVTTDNSNASDDQQRSERQEDTAVSDKKTTNGESSYNEGDKSSLSKDKEESKNENSNRSTERNAERVQTRNLGVEKQPKASTFERVLPSISVLVVEDNAINQAILGAFLRKHKIRYQIAKNGQEAVDKWKKGGFHLVLMDIQLPVKSGIEATKEIRHLEKVNQIGVFAQHELSNTQHDGLIALTEDEKLDLSVFRSPVIIVALTASSNSSVDRKNALTAGCNDFLTKPVNLVWLQNKITEWGCMQALIDFDGWKVKRVGNDNPKQPVMTQPHPRGDDLVFRASAIAS